MSNFEQANEKSSVQITENRFWKCAHHILAIAQKLALFDQKQNEHFQKFPMSFVVAILEVHINVDDDSVGCARHHSNLALDCCHNCLHLPLWISAIVNVEVNGGQI